MHLHGVFAPFFARGGTIIAVTGNHDREDRIEMLRAGMRLAAPVAGNRRFLTSRMYLLNRPYSSQDQPAPRTREIVTALTFE